MTSPDPRIHPYRADIAAEHLRGVVNAKTYVSGKPQTLFRGLAGLHKQPDIRSEQVSQLRYGDGFTVYEHSNEWLWGQCARDGYVGYAKCEGFREDRAAPTHRIKKQQSFVFPNPSIKDPPIDTLTFFSGVEVVGGDEKFSKIKSGGYVHSHHIIPIANWQERDVVFTAGRMLGIPYLWGGNTSLGLDCSGLIQLACEAAGIACPRDSDMQAAQLGNAIADVSKLHRGDIVFFPGHVGVMTDATALLHANAYHGCVAVEPLKNVIQRGSNVSCVRRM